MKFIFKWLFRLCLLAVVLAVVFLLSLDSLLRIVAEKSIRTQTGMDAEIGQFHLGLIEPMVTIRNLKIYNPPSFGGTPFLDLPEIHVEYDRAALAKNELHLTLVRVNLRELDIVKNEAGQTNLFALGVTLPTKKTASDQKELADFKKQTGMTFQGADVVNVSVGTLKFIDLKNSRNNREQKVGIENQVFKNVKTSADLDGLKALFIVRSIGFWGSLAAPTGSLWP